MLKNPRSFIRYPFIDPGSVYDGNVWDWDTYWSVYGFLNLADSYQDPSVKPRIIEHAQGNIRNFFDHQLEDGYIPMMIEVADWPEPYLNMRHKEGKIMNMHKPFLCSQMCLISDYTGDYAWTEEFLSGVAKYFECYDHYYFHENSGLYVWQDDIMIGMEMIRLLLAVRHFPCQYLSEQLYVCRTGSWCQIIQTVWQGGSGKETSG